MRTKTNLMIAATAAAALLALTGAASAAELPVDMPVLTASVQGDDLAVRYRVDRQDWSQLMGYGISPVLHVYVARAPGGYEHTVSAPLTRASGSLLFQDHAARHGHGQIMLQVTRGARRAPRPTAVSVGAAAPMTDTGNACSEFARHDSTVIRCINLSQGMRARAPYQVVRVCGGNTETDAAFLQCIEASRALAYDATQTANFCAQNNIETDSRMIACIDAAAGKPRREPNATYHPTAQPVYTQPVYTQPSYTPPVYTAPERRPARRVRPAPSNRVSWSASARVTF